MKTIHLLYGLRASDKTRYTEVLLATGTAERCEKIKTVAARDGFHSFRITTHTDGIRPDFATAVSR